jgi:hypothetical protein
MESLELEKGFPDLNPRFHHIRVDPLEPGRVWATSRYVRHRATPSLLGHGYRRRQCQGGRRCQTLALAH